MQKYDDIRLSDLFINKTSEDVFVYDIRDGNIRRFSPSFLPLSKTPLLPSGEPIVHYIVTPELAKEIKVSGRELDDIAILHGSSAGRDGVMISSLLWGKFPEIPVKLYGGAYALGVPHR